MVKLMIITVMMMMMVMMIMMMMVMVMVMVMVMMMVMKMIMIVLLLMMIVVAVIMNRVPISTLWRIFDAWDLKRKHDFQAPCVIWNTEIAKMHGRSLQRSIFFFKKILVVHGVPRALGQPRIIFKPSLKSGGSPKNKLYRVKKKPIQIIFLLKTGTRQSVSFVVKKVDKIYQYKHLKCNVFWSKEFKIV